MAGPRLAGDGYSGRRSEDEHYDVIIVGGRCAGSSLAALLAREGLKVVVLEQVQFPKSTLSSHLMEADGVLFLKRLGVLDAVTATGIRFMKQMDLRFNELRLGARFPLQFDDLGGAAFLRRDRLDSILSDNASASGAEVRMGAKVVELLWHRDRVNGVVCEQNGQTKRIHAPLVVGADGRRSTVGYMTGARRYNVTTNERSYYFTFFEGAHPEFSDHFVFHRWGDRMVWAGPADGGLYLVGVSPEEHERDYFRTNTEAGLLAHMRSCEPTAQALDEARVATKISGISKFDAYFRQASGPGWVLAGDAGHFKDPSIGRGIGDAFLQVEALAPAIVDGLGGRDLDDNLRRWWAWRDARFEGHYRLSGLVGMRGELPGMVPEAIRRLDERNELDEFLHLFSHRRRFDDVFPLTDMGLATARAFARGSTGRTRLLVQASKLLADEPVRRWRRRFPRVAAADLTAAPRGRETATEPAQAVDGAAPAPGTEDSLRMVQP